MKAYLVDVGKLLIPNDNNYNKYNNIYDKKYDYSAEKLYYLKYLDDAVKDVRKYVQIDNMNYGVISKVDVPDDFDYDFDFKHKPIISTVDQDEEFLIQNVVYSIAKIDNNIVDDFMYKNALKGIECLKDLEIYITNIKWNIDIYDVIAELDSMPKSNVADILGIPRRIYNNMYDDERYEYIYDVLKYNNPLKAKILNLPDKISIPVVVTDIDIYVYDKYGYGMSSYLLDCNKSLDELSNMSDNPYINNLITTLEHEQAGIERD